MALSFNADTASSLGLRPRVAHLAMLALVALAVVASFQAVGTLLVFGLLVAPPAAASLVVRRVSLMMLVAIVIGVLSVVVGLLVSYHHGTAASATMAFTAVSAFFVVLAVREALDALGPDARSAL
jgi:ABC-type Mn2+/Zn2+ transport system permease subunit